MVQVAASEVNPQVEARARADRVVVTRAHFAAPPDRVWAALLYYEQIDRRPPWLLRRLLPVPIRTVGAKQAPGDLATCEYERGHLVKRVTEIDPGRLYRFSVVEQQLAVGNVRLSGGAYTLTGDGSGTEVALETRYSGGRAPRWLFAPVEKRVCHRFHQHILDAMQNAVRVSV